MGFNASEYHSYYQLQVCALRVYHKAHGTRAADDDEYHELLKRLGARHEREHLATFTNVFDAKGNAEETRKAVAAKLETIYQPRMQVTHDIYGEVVGIPDFFIREGDNYVIRDCKLSRRFNEKDHPEIVRQLELYGWLFEQNFGCAPARLEAYLGDRQIKPTPYIPETALQMLVKINGIKQLKEEPYEPVGWTKCLDCSFNEPCWDAALHRQDVSLLPSVDQSLARVLHKDGIISYVDLVKHHTEDSLTELKRPVGTKQNKVGKAATKILLQAQSLIENKIIQVDELTLPTDANIAVFDVEGIPPHLEISEKTYLWGLKVFGEKPSVYLAAMGDVGDSGDQQGWRHFLEACKQIFETYGNIPFLHWSPYERTQMRKYLDRYGDVDGVAERIMECLFDLFPVIQQCLVLPVHSYGLKTIEQAAGFTRKLQERNGKWSMAMYIEAIETADPEKAKGFIDEILKYNEDDLDALWAVYKWAQKFA